ncbi:NAD(P)/FAD-dependent oxidoreductase [Thalassospira sp.]|uniref:NAD(P)/FAD-dependent oxidoreductase n=1 Tax=Thalassospira sp. TaxID=1912094 RepID=UPI002736A30C|nr:FAD-dependent oxidoreductase [Thalassospira sp.]MDP2697725.1 FAD-dependent oxidoreductase [Thalassospira sp.]
MSQQKIAIIGAGMTGLKAASSLNRAGFSVTVFEKRHSLGGRLATRRTELGMFNHGAQYVTAKRPDFTAYLIRAANLNAASGWHPHIHPQPGGNADPRQDWYRGAPQMNRLVNPLLASYPLIRQSTITAIEPLGRKFILHGAADEQFGEFDSVIVTAPAPQTANLLMPLSGRFDCLGDVTMAPCWAVMVAFAKSLDMRCDAMLHPDPAISWAARSEASMPGRPDLWVIHASPQWSQDHLEDDRDRVISRLLARFEDVNPALLPAVISVDAHLWRFARTQSPLGRSHLAGLNGRIIAAGDWCLGARVEAAYDSGRCAANALIETFYG